MSHLRAALGLFALLFVLLVSPDARADEPEDEANRAVEPPAVPAPAPARAATPRTEDQGPRPWIDEPPKRRQLWYGWQTLIADGAALTALYLAASSSRNQSPSGEKAALASSVIIFVAVPPAIHLAHERPGAAVGSLLLRALPVALIASSVNSSSSSELGLAGLVLVPAAIAIDAAALAREPVTKRQSLLPGLSPRVSLRREGGFDVGIGVAL